MRILITGGAGYKGLKLSQRLLEAGHEVTVLDNFMYGYEPCLFLFQYPNVRFVHRDIRALERSDVAPFDCIFHLAGISSYPACEANPHSAQMINLSGSETLLSHMSPQQLLVYASTTSIYARASEVCTEQSHVSPGSLYASTKYAAEQRCMQRENSVALRFATLFGVAPRMRRDLLPNDFVMRAVQERALILFDPSSIRTFLHVDDAIRAYLMVLDQSDAMRGDVYNVGNERLNLSKKQIAEKIAEHVEFNIIDSTLVDPDARNFIVNFDKIAALGFRPEKTLDEGIRELISLFRFYRPTQPYKTI